MFDSVMDASSSAIRFLNRPADIAVTKRYVSTLKPDGKTRFHWDDALSGFGVRVKRPVWCLGRCPAGPADDDDPGLLRIHNRRLAREKGYLIGANRLLGLDYAIILLILGACSFPIAHGGLRVLFRRSR